MAIIYLSTRILSIVQLHVHGLEIHGNSDVLEVVVHFICVDWHPEHEELVLPVYFGPDIPEKYPQFSQQGVLFPLQSFLLFLSELPALGNRNYRQRFLNRTEGWWVRAGRDFSE